MAKRRRRTDERKIHKRERQSKSRSHRESRDDFADDEREVHSGSSYRRRSRSSSRRDVSVILVAVIIICTVIGGYFFIEFYNDSSDNEDLPNEQIKRQDDDNNYYNNNNNNNPPGTYEVPSFDLLYPNNPVVVIEIRDRGVIVLEIYRNKNVQATVNNFLDYVYFGFYDGLIFHRIIDDFMIQGGGFFPDMVQKELPPGKEAIDLEIDPSLLHVDGALAMARTSDPDSATCQFYICDGPQSFLDGQYAVFGQTVAGMDLVRELAEVDTSSSDQPVNDVVINRAYEYLI